MKSPDIKKTVQVILMLGTELINLLALPAAAETKTLDYIVAVVNDEVIVNTALQQELRAAEKKLHQQNIAIPSHQDLEKQVLESMIMVSLQLQLAERTGIQVEDSRLNESLRKIARRNNLDLPDFRKALEQDGYQYEQVREKIRNDMIINRLQHRQVASRINITEREIDNFLANQVLQGAIRNEYHIWHILIATPETPSPEQIEAKKQEANEILAQLTRGADFQALAVSISDSRTALEGGDLGWLKAGEMPTLFNGIVDNMALGEIKGPIRDASGFHLIKLADKRGSESSIVTQTQVRQILIKTDELVSDLEAQTRLEKLKARIEQGEDFMELARANSADTATAANGGLMDWVNPGELVPEFEEVMNRLSENQVSEPFKSRYGWHIMQVLARRQHDNTEQALRAKAALQIQQRKIEEELQAWWRQLRDEAYVECRLDYLKKDCSIRKPTS